jgi:hypothetical protein
MRRRLWRAPIAGWHATAEVAGGIRGGTTHQSNRGIQGIEALKFAYKQF